MIFNPVVSSSGGVTMDELFFGSEGTVRVSVEEYKALLVLYSNYSGTDFMQVGHVPIQYAISLGSGISLGFDGSGGSFLSAYYSDGTIEISSNTGADTIYAVYGIK